MPAMRRLAPLGAGGAEAHWLPYLTLNSCWKLLYEKYETACWEWWQKRRFQWKLGEHLLIKFVLPPPGCYHN